MSIPEWLTHLSLLYSPVLSILAGHCWFYLVYSRCPLSQGSGSRARTGPRVPQGALCNPRSSPDLHHTRPHAKAISNLILNRIMSIFIGFVGMQGFIWVICLKYSSYLSAFVSDMLRVSVLVDLHTSFWDTFNHWRIPANFWPMSVPLHCFRKSILPVKTHIWSRERGKGLFYFLKLSVLTLSTLYATITFFFYTFFQLILYLDNNFHCNHSLT